MTYIDTIDDIDDCDCYLCLQDGYGACTERRQAWGELVDKYRNNEE